MHQILIVDCTQRLLHPLQIWSILLTPYVRITKNIFNYTGPYLDQNLLILFYPNLAFWFLLLLSITAQGSKLKYFVDRLRRQIDVFRQFWRCSTNRRGSGVPQHQLYFVLSIKHNFNCFSNIGSEHACWIKCLIKYLLTMSYCVLYYCLCYNLAYVHIYFRSSLSLTNDIFYC